MFVIILCEQSSLDIEDASYGIDQISQKHDLLYEIFFYIKIRDICIRKGEFCNNTHIVHRIRAIVIQWVHISSFCKLIEILVSYKILRTPA
jgi:hypothetical protein